MATSPDDINDAIGYATEPFTKNLHLQGLNTVSAIIGKMYDSNPSFRDTAKEVLIDGTIGGVAATGRAALQQQALAKAAVQRALDQGLLISKPKIPWGTVLRTGAKGAGVTAAGTAAFELGYYAGTKLDEQFNLSGSIAKYLVPSYDPNDTSYRTEEFQKTLEDVIRNRKKREEADRLKREKVFGK